MGAGLGTNELDIGMLLRSGDCITLLAHKYMYVV